jgi:hypothetical protein
MSAHTSLYTANATPHWIWITIYDLAKTTHLDYGWVQPNSVRGWASGNYCWGSFYYVRAEVKAGTGQDGGNIFDTTVQVNPQSSAVAIAVVIDVITAGLGEAGGGQWTQELEGSGNAVRLTGDASGKFWWEHSN